MLNKKQLIKYNRQDTLLAISSYPPKGTTYGKGVGGVASFAKNTLLPISRYKKIVVLAEILKKPRVYEENGILVVRCWRRDSANLYKDLIHNVFAFSKIKQVLIEFEFGIYGDFVLTSFFPLFLLVLRLLGKRTYTVVHQVLINLKSLSGHLGLSAKSLKLKLMSRLLKVYYKILALGSVKIVVLEKEFERRLVRLGVNKEKVQTIPHGVDLGLRRESKQIARKKLGIKPNEFVVLCFGFVTWYKGADIVVRAFSELKGKNIRFILAGGKSITQGAKGHYQDYYAEVERLVSNDKRIDLTGFVPEEKIKTYFSACDLVILPYRTFMSSSGVLSLTLSFEKPFVASEILRKWFLNGEREFLEKAVFFDLSPQAVAYAIKRIQRNKVELRSLARISKKIKHGRSYDVLANYYLDVLRQGWEVSLPRGAKPRLARAGLSEVVS